jgi:hypothetical protein
MTDIPEDIMREARGIVQSACGCAPGRRRSNGTSHHDSCNDQVLVVARALLAAEKRGAERERERAAGKADAVRQRLEAGRKRPLSQIDEHVASVADGIAAAIRKEG